MSERKHNHDREHERNRGVAVQLWKREGIIPPGFAGAIARWRRLKREQAGKEDER
jgi:hypothetical protein